jgi:hypothetical protein
MNTHQTTTTRVLCNVFKLTDHISVNENAWNYKYSSITRHYNAGQYAEAAEAANSCIAEAPKIFTEHHPLQASCYLQLGKAQSAMGQISDALRSFKDGSALCRAGEHDLGLKIALTSNLARALSSQDNKHRSSLAAYIKTVRLIEQLNRTAPETELQTKPLKIEVLKELTALQLSLEKFSQAERFIFSLAALQELPSERGKTLILLAHNYRCEQKLEQAVITTKNAICLLTSSCQETGKSSALADAYQLLGGLSSDLFDFVEARLNYQKAQEVYAKTLGPDNRTTLLSLCDIGLIDIRFKRWLAASAIFNKHLEQAISISKKGANDPKLLKYLQAHAAVDHHIGNGFLAANAIANSLPSDQITLSGVEKALQARGLVFLWNTILQAFPQGLERASLASFLKTKYEENLQKALQRYVQAASSIQNKHGKSHISLAELYEFKSNAHRGLGDIALAKKLLEQADLIRLRNNKQNRGDQ